MKKNKKICLFLGVLFFMPVLAQGEEGRDGFKDLTPGSGSFDGVHFSVSGSLLLKKGAEPLVLAKGEKKALDNLVVRIKGNTLIIERKKKSFSLFRKEDKVEFMVTLPRIQELALSGSGSVEMGDSFESQGLHLTISGSGDLYAQGRFTNVDASLTGSGELEFLGEAVSLDIKINGSGSAYFQGSTQEIIAAVNGSGELDAEDMTAEKVQINITGSGSAEVAATESLTGKLSGSGSLFYTGSPPLFNIQSTGSGKILSLE